MKKVLTMISLVAASTGAIAQNVGSMYGEVDYVAIKIKDTSALNLGTFDTKVGKFTLGKVVANNLAVEGFITQGLSGDSKVVNGVKIDIDQKMGYGIALRPFIRASDNIELFGRLGSSRSESEVTASANGRSASESGKTTNTLYGIGVAYKINKDSSAILDYTKLDKKDDMNISMVSVGVRFNF